MDVKNGAGRFDQAVSMLPDSLRNILEQVPVSVKAAVYEIRLRVGSPLSVVGGTGCWFVDGRGQLHNIPRYCFHVTAEAVADAVVSICDCSIHSHQQEIQNGYISLRGGHRAGICGTAVLRDGKITAVRDVTSINLRVAREVQGAADVLMERIFSDGLHSTLIVGIPSSGKTTVLRDLARQLSGGHHEQYHRVAVVDERGELGAVCDGIPQNDLGPCTDILNGYPRGAGIMTAVRTLSPQIIICDEIGSREEVDSMLDGLNCGVRFIATAHASGMTELSRRRQIMRLLQNRVFEYIVFLGDAKQPGCIREIIEAGELTGENMGNPAYTSVFDSNRNASGFRAVCPGAGY